MSVRTWFTMSYRYETHVKGLTRYMKIQKRGSVAGPARTLQRDESESQHSPAVARETVRRTRRR